MSASLNILLTNATDIYGGGEFYVLELARTLLKRGHRPLVACRPSNLLAVKCRNAGIPLVPVDFPPTGRLGHYVRILWKLIRAEGIGVVHTNSNYDRTAGAFAARMAGVCHVTNVHSFHSLQHNITHWIRNRFATDHYLVDGKCLRDLLVNGDGIDSRKISVMYLGVDPESMKRDERLRMMIRREFGILDDEVLIGTVGRMVPMKGHAYLMRGFAAAALEVPSARLVIVGDGVLAEDLRRLASELGISGRVIFPGFRDDLVALYSAFDIYVHPSIEGGGETFPFAVLQALSQELPVVVTRVGDVPAMVEEGQNGFIVPDRHADALAHAILTLLQNAPLRNRLAVGGRQLLLRSFTLDRMVDDVEKTYHTVMMPGR